MGVTITESVNVSIVTPGPLSVSASESVSVNDICALLLSIFITVSSSVTTGESVIVSIPDLNLSASESVTMGESVGAALSDLAVQASESIGVSDVPSGTVTYLPIAVSDSITVNEYIKSHLLLLINVNESVTLTEQVSSSLPDALQASASDLISAGESIDATLAIFIAVADAVLVSDQPTALVPTVPVSASESVTTGEAAFIAVSDLDISVSESISVGDSASATVSDLSLSVSESVTTGESVGVSLSPLTISTSESVTVGESIDVFTGDLGISVSESVTVTDEPYILIYYSTWQHYADQYANSPVVLVDIEWNSGTRYYSFGFVRTSLYQYKGKILSIANIKTSVGNIDRTYERSKISIIFDDTDYEFRGLEETETVGPKNIVVKITLSSEDDKYINTKTIFTGYIYDWKPLENLQYRIDIKETSKNLDNVWPWKRVVSGDYANADETALGWTVPIPYGEISASGLSNDGAYGHPSLSQEGLGTGLPMIDNTVDSEKHLVGRQVEAITVDRVYKNGVPQTLTTHYTIASAVIDGKTHTTINWVSGVRPTNSDFISCDITFGSRRPIMGITHFLKEFAEYDQSTWFGNGRGSENDQLLAPYGVDCDGTYIFIADTFNHRIMKLNASTLAYIDSIGTQGSGNNQFDYPADVASDGTYIYVADRDNHRIVKRNVSDLSYVSQIGTEGSGNDQFDNPYGITTDGTNVFVADFSNTRIKKHLCSDLSYVSHAAANYVRGISVSGDYLYNVDISNDRIVKRNKSDLAIVDFTGSFGTGDGQFRDLWGIVCDGTYVYVTDYLNSRIQKFTASGLDFVNKIGSDGKTGEDEFKLLTGITVSGSYIFVLDIYAHEEARAPYDIYDDLLLKRNTSDLNQVKKPRAIKLASYKYARFIEDGRGYDFAGALWESKQLQTILDEWRNQYELDIYWDENGEVCFNYFSSSFTESSNSYEDYLHVLGDYKPDPQTDKIVNFVQYGYNKHYSKTYFYSIDYTEDTASQTKHGMTRKKFYSLDWVRKTATAEDIGMRKLSQFKDPVVFIELLLPLKSFSDELADLFKITHFEGTRSSGYDQTPFQLRSKSLNLNNFTNTVLLELTNSLFVNFISDSVTVGESVSVSIV